MVAKTPKQRQQEKRARDKLSAEEREARLLSRRITMELYHNEDAALLRVMSRLGITEEQDVMSRLIRGADLLDDVQLKIITKVS